MRMRVRGPFFISAHLELLSWQSIFCREDLAGVRVIQSSSSVCTEFEDGVWYKESGVKDEVSLN